MAQRRRPAAGPISLFHVAAGKAGTDARIGLEAGRRWAPGGGRRRVHATVRPNMGSPNEPSYFQTVV